MRGKIKKVQSRFLTMFCVILCAAAFGGLLSELKDF